MSSKKKDFRGVYVASVTPMDKNGGIDFDMLAKFIDGQIKSGIHGIIPLGSTGEFYAMTPQEREDVLKAVIEAVSGRVPVLAGTNASSTADVIAYSKQAEQLGVDGLLIAAPYYSLPTHDELFKHFKAVNNAVGIPIMLYNYPGRTGVDLVPDLVERLADLDNVKYIKESTGDITRISEIIKRMGDRIGVFCGADLIPVESFVLGAIGWVGGIANVLPKSHVKLYELAVVKGDIPAARKFFYEIFYALQAIETSGIYTQYVKAGCEIMGNPVGPPRMPLGPVSKKDYKKLEEILKTVKSEGAKNG